VLLEGLLIDAWLRSDRCSPVVAVVIGRSGERGERVRAHRQSRLRRTRTNEADGAISIAGSIRTEVQPAGEDRGERRRRSSRSDIVFREPEAKESKGLVHLIELGRPPSAP